MAHIEYAMQGATTYRWGTACNKAEQKATKSIHVEATSEVAMSISKTSAHTVNRQRRGGAKNTVLPANSNGLPKESPAVQSWPRELLGSIVLPGR